MLFDSRTHRNARSGLTLLELLLVLVILAVVATLAVQALQPRVDMARLNQTGEILAQIEKAVEGQPLVEGQKVISQSGFVADLGRLPAALRNAAPAALRIGGAGEQVQEAERPLAELWDDQSRVAVDFPYRFRPGPKTPHDMSDVQLPCGWRGPYLQLPMGKDELADAWNREFEYGWRNGAQIDEVRWRRLEFYGEERPDVQADLSQSLVTVAGRIDFGDANPSQVDVYLLTPDPEHSRVELKPLDDEDEQPATFLFSDVPIGLRAIFIHYDGKSTVEYVQVPPGGLTTLVDLETGAPDN